MLTLTQYAARKGLSRMRIHQLLVAGRIPGAKLIGKENGNRGIWLIPDGARIKRLTSVKRRA